MKDSELKWLADTYEQVQKVRVGLSNRIQAVADEKDTGPVPDVIRKSYDSFYEKEKDIAKEMKTAIESHPAWSWLKQVKGVSYILACRLVSEIDIERAETISALWRYCGMGVIEGKAERPVKGEKRHDNKRMKKVCYIIGTSFLKSKSPFRAVYDEAKERYQRERKDWTKLHIHLAAMRKMEKVFLSCLWLYWREQEGLPVTNPYVQDIMKHKNIYGPEDFVA